MRPGLTSTLAALSAAAALVACSPALDWRDVRPAGSGLVMLFPCRPEQAERVVAVAAASVSMRLASCAAASATFSLAVLDAGAPERAQALLDALQKQTVANVGGIAMQLPVPRTASAPLLGGALHLRIEGKLPDGRPVIEEALFFSRGARVYQATMLGTAQRAGSEPGETFFGSIRVP